MKHTTWTKYWEAAAAQAARLKPLMTQKWTRLWLPPLDTAQGLILFGAALHLGLDPLFDEKSENRTAEALLVCPPELLPPRDQKAALAFTGTPPPEILAKLQQRTLWFCTSGSTGPSRPLAKGAAGLLLEGKVLAELYALRPGKTIVSLLRPFHLYGFLHAFLLPLVASCEVIHWPYQHLLPTLEDGFPKTPDLVLMVPAHWRLLQLIWRLTPTRAVVTSGAPFGSERTTELQGFKDKCGSLFEILGSTETGGIGYRRVDLGEQSFALFPDLRLEPAEHGTIVHSPFVAPASSVVTADRLESVDPKHFVHKGRSDRLFKYAGLRYSLEMIETELSRLCGAVKVVCFFHEDTVTAQGGYVEAWIETAELSESNIPTLRTRAAAGGTPMLFPQRVHFLPRLPRDAQGKVTLALLRAATT